MIIFLFISLLFASDELIKKIELKTDELSLIIANSYKTAPIFKDGGATLPSGVTLSPLFYSKLKTRNLDFCHDEIKKNGYQKIIEGQKIPKALKATYDSFYNSTKNAEAHHRERVVFFKKGVSTLNCYHELIHLYQQKSSVAPYGVLHRDREHDDFARMLGDGANYVEKLERDNKIDLAKRVGKIIERGISILRLYDDLSETLDETEIYTTLYRFCQKESCSPNDVETLLANLFKYKEFLPWKIRDEISSHAVQSLAKKERAAYQKVEYKKFSEEDLTFFKKLLTLSPTEIVSEGERLGIKHYSLKSSFKNDCGSDSLPTDFIKSLPDITEEILPLFSGYSKIFDGAAIGKYLCDHKMRFIVLSHKSCKETLLHEVMHDFQRKNNPLYCEALTLQEAILKEFKSGKINRDEFEKRVLRYKGILYKAEREMYSLFLENSPYQNINDFAMRLTYEARLLEKEDRSLSAMPLPLTLTLETKNDLPAISIKELGFTAIFDLGAMKSVFPPINVFENYKRLKVDALRLVTLQKSDGALIEAPYVQFANVLTLSGVPFSNLSASIANLKLKGIDGVIGLDFLAQFDLEIFPQEMKVVLHERLPDSLFENALPLQADWDDKISAIEFICQGNVARVDTGSQVLFDGNIKELDCNTFKVLPPDSKDLRYSPIFDRGVSVNLGWPWIKQWKRVLISIKQKKIRFD